MIYLRTLLTVLLTLLFSPSLLGQQLTILHTNDWQSNFLGHGPNSEYTPQTANDDQTIGGIARLATLIKNKRQQHEKDGPVLLLDGGDMTMGTLFHTVSTTDGFELQLMNTLGYDAAAIGNHEFDYNSQGLANMIEAASQGMGSPILLASNLNFDPIDKNDDALESLMDGPILKRYQIIERQGLKFGLFGLMGRTAAEFVYPNDSVVKFSDIIESATNMVDFLRNEKGVDFVILLSHCGIKRNEDGVWRGEEVELAEQVSGIDVIVGGHSHTALFDPITVNNTTIVQAGAYSEFLGELILEVKGQQLALKSYQLLAVDDSIVGDQATLDTISQAVNAVNTKTLKSTQYTLTQPIAEIGSDLGRHYNEHILSNIITDSIRFAADSNIALTSNGMIRANLQKGQYGIQSVADFFRVTPLGLGVYDDKPGYPLIKVYISAQELKSILESMLFIYQIKGASYYPRVSGIRFYYNELRPPLDKIWDIQLETKDNDYVSLDFSDQASLLSVAVTSYVGSFLNVITRDSYGLLSITPKDQQGQSITVVKNAIIDQAPTIPGIQEIKEWQALIAYVSQFADTNNNGIADIPQDGPIMQARMVASDDFVLSELFSGATYILWVTISVYMLILIALLFLLKKLINYIRP